MQMVDNTLREVPVAKIQISTPYLSGEVEALCPPDDICDLFAMFQEPMLQKTLTQLGNKVM